MLSTAERFWATAAEQKQATGREGGRHAKGPDRAPLHVGGENSDGLRRHDFARIGIDLGGGAGLILLRPEV
jgi:hypothetical protein